MSLERSRSGSNYGKILDHLAELGSGRDAQSGPDGGVGVVIDELLIRQVHAKLRFASPGGRLTEYEVEIPEIRVRGLGSGSAEGLQIPALIADVTKAILKAIADKSGRLPINLAGDVNRRLARLGLPEIEVPGGVNERAGRIGDRIGEAAERAGDVIEGLGGLLKRKQD